MSIEAHMTGAEGYDYLRKYWPDARRDWTPAQRVYIIAAWEALPVTSKAGWFLLPGEQSGPNYLDLIASGDGPAVLEAAKAGEWL